MKTYDVKKTQYRVSDFVSWQRSGSLVLSPIFQRRSVWRPGARSYFIDTLVRNLPIPIIILREKRTDLTSLEPSREVVDGQQRIRTVFTFIDAALLGSDYRPDWDDFKILKAHNKELAGKEFAELDRDIQQRILDYEFSVHALPAAVDDREVLQIFARLNATGYKLTSQELRNAEYFGAFKTSMYMLASEQLNRWREWGIFTEYNLSRMEEVELTSEFALQMLRKRVIGKSQASLNQVYERFDDEFPEREEVERRFRKMMDTIDEKIGDRVRWSPFRRKTLFFSLFTFFYDLAYGTASDLSSKRPKSVPESAVQGVQEAAENIESKSAPASVLDAVARRTTHSSSRQTLIEYLHKMAGNASEPG